MAVDTAVVETAADMAAGARVALVAGATGLVGREVLAVLLADNSYSVVHSVGRRSLPFTHAKLIQHVVNLQSEAGLGALPRPDDVFITLGTTIKVAGSQTAFKAVDFEAVVAVARNLHAKGATKLGVISAMGADPRSAVFYNRVKGEMESALADVGYSSLTIARPSMLAGDRDALNQPSRLGERIALSLTRSLKPLIPANYRSIQARDVAAALVKSVKTGNPGTTVLLSGSMQGIGADLPLQP